jgi:uncharacterized protein YjbI with pentapeptide repeats
MVVIALSTIGLSACGSSTPNDSRFVPSTDCTVSASNVDYAGCNLAHHDLSGVDLSSDNFRRANLSSANLDGANLQGADLRGATTSGVLTNASTVCVNATFGPCTEPGLRAS